MRRFIGVATVWVAILGSSPTSAAPYPDDDEQRHVPIFVTGVFLNREAAERAAQTDLKFSQSMMRHHQGAIDMARLYLGDPRGTNPILGRLSRGIIKNQQFEIGVLDVVSKQVSEGPREIAGA